MCYKWQFQGNANDAIVISTVETVCLKCGDIGFEVALVFCSGCQAYALHRYLLSGPVIFTGPVKWFCDDCVKKLRLPPSLDQSTPLSSVTRNYKNLEKNAIQSTRVFTNCKERVKKRNKLLKKKNKKEHEKGKVNSAFVDETKGVLSGSHDIQHPQHISSQEEREVTNECEAAPRDVTNSDLAFNRSDLEVQKSFYYLHLKLVNFYSCCGEYHLKLNFLVNRGSIYFCNETIGAVSGLLAHMSDLACSKVVEETGHFPEVLHAELVPRSTVWPESFKSREPTDQDIALFFFPDSEGAEKVFDALVDDVICHEYAIRFDLKLNIICGVSSKESKLGNREIMLHAEIDEALREWKTRGTDRACKVSESGVQVAGRDWTVRFYGRQLNTPGAKLFHLHRSVSQAEHFGTVRFHIVIVIHPEDVRSCKALGHRSSARSYEMCSQKLFGIEYLTLALSLILIFREGASSSRGRPLMRGNGRSYYTTPGARDDRATCSYRPDSVLWSVMSIGIALPVACLRWLNIVTNPVATQQLAPTVGQGFKNSQGAMATKFDVEKFNGTNDFGLWKIKMQAILIQQGCDEALKGESKMSGTMTQEEKKKMGDKARSAIILCLGDKVLREVAKEKTAAEIWVKLESLYMTRSLAHRLCLKQQLFSFKMSESRTIEEQIAEFSKIVDDLENIGVKLEDEDKAVILLNALPKTFEHFRDALLYGKDQVITLEEVLTSIRTKEFQKLQDSKTTEEGASGLIAVKGKGKKQSGKEKKLNPDGTKQVRCFKCQKMGHIKKFCPEKGKAGRSQETADVAEASEGYESAGVLVASSEDPQRSWVMDSGCSYHMCPVKEFFENLDQKEHGNVLLGNNKACRVQGVGSVRLKMFDNREMVLQAVRYVPELKRNLISISAFDLGGYTTKVEDGVMRVCSGDSVVAKGRRRNGLYILEGSTVIGHVSVASGTENTARLWHLRMGHISEKGLEELEKQDLLLGDKLQKLDFCDHCVLGKSHRIPFGKGKHSTERPFEYVHADLWGPARTLTHGGGAYFLSIIDDFSRRVWIYVLKNKSETFQKFKEWHTQIENQLGCRLKCLRTDNGLEFVSEEFNGFCKEKGIKRHRTVVGTPQQNGLAERMNRTILERVRCMLLGSGLSKAFWGEAANTAVYLINRSPSSALNFKTPMEVWSGRPADYSHLRVFGSLAFAHVRGDKLDSRAARCIFLGYADGVKGYRLWRLDSPSKLIISRDVIFDETRMAMHPENSGSEKKILVEVEHTTNGAGTAGGTEENQTGEGQVETGRTIAENRPDEFRTDLGEDTDYMSGEGSHGKAAGVDLRNYQLVRDRERRISKPTKRLGEADLICYALNAAEDINRSDEPRSYKEVLDSSDRHLWQGAMEEELEALKKNNTWRLVDLPKGKKVIGSKWIFKKKEATPGGEKARYKARLVAKGFTQIEGVDYHEIFAPVVKHCSVRVLMAIVAHCNLHLEQLDVRTAFLHGDLEETLYMKQPDGFAVDDRVCLLQKSLYGLKQSPRQWYRKFDDFLIKLNFKRCNYDDCVYTLNHGGEILYLLLYVDDILIASSDRGMIGETKARLADAFEMKELGEARRILGIDIKRDRPGGNLFCHRSAICRR
ncbi:hypothetical protein V8G54_030518 [Vigna mungo]|uniref:Uncharacterized protein n=1 Tax=Vigna mungo TaxID=3915 RepID=A0AAQ3RMG7_VIGMU